MIPFMHTFRAVCAPPRARLLTLDQLLAKVVGHFESNSGVSFGPLNDGHLKELGVIEKDNVAS